MSKCHPSGVRNKTRTHCRSRLLSLHSRDSAEVQYLELVAGRDRVLTKPCQTSNVTKWKYSQLGILHHINVKMSSLSMKAARKVVRARDSPPGPRFSPSTVFHKPRAPRDRLPDMFVSLLALLGKLLPKASV